MITTITLEVRCDRLPHCIAYTTDMDGEGIDHDMLADRLRSENWIVTESGEHICPTCAPACRAEQADLERQELLDEECNDPRHGQARAINAGCY